MSDYKFEYIHEKREEIRQKKLAEEAKKEKFEEFGLDDAMDMHGDSEKIFRLMTLFAKKQGIAGVRAQELTQDILNLFYIMIDRGKYGSGEARVVNKMIDKIKNLLL